MWELLADLQSASLVTQAITYTGIVATLSLALNYLNFRRQRRLDRVDDYRTCPRLKLLTDNTVWDRGWRHAVVDIRNPSDDEHVVRHISIKPRRMKFAPQAVGASAPDFDKVSFSVTLKAKNIIAAKGGYGDDVYWLAPGPDDSCREHRATVLVQQTSYPNKKWKLRESVAVPLAKHQR